MNYSILLQNNTTNETQVFNKVDMSDSTIYYHFQNIDASSLDEGEYTYYIIENQDSSTITINPNDIGKSTINDNLVVIKAKGLLRVGNYNTDNTEYNGTTQYKQYNG